MQGQWFSAIDGFKVYLLGNPIIWWGNLVVLAAFVFVYIYQAYRRQRGAFDDRQTRGMCFIRVNVLHTSTVQQYLKVQGDR